MKDQVLELLEARWNELNQRSVHKHYNGGDRREQSEKDFTRMDEVCLMMKRIRDTDGLS